MIKTPIAPGDRKVPWLNQCRSGWNFKPIKYFCSINKRVLSENVNPSYEIKYIDISSVNSNGKWVASNPMTFLESPSRARRVVSDGDVLISTVRTYLGAIAFVEKAEENLICSTGFAVLSPGKSINSKFLAYWVRSTFFVDEIVARSVGVSYPAINAPYIGNLPFPLIGFEEQNAIASLLDRETQRIETLISKKEQQIALLQEKRSALISRAVTKGLDPNVKMKDSGIEWLGKIPEHWEVRRLKYSSDIINQKADGCESGLPYTGLEHIESWTGKRITPNGDASSEGQANLYRRGDVLFGKLRPYLAKAHAADIDGICTGELLVLRPKAVLQNFLRDYVLNPDFISIVDSSTYGAKMPRANWDFIGSLPILVPPLTEQRAIEEFLARETTKIDALVKKVEESIAMLREYRTALISAAVTGKIDVRNAA